MAAITLSGLGKTYPAQGNAWVRKAGDVEAVKGIDLHVEDGELLVLVGPSGCGKSTLLRMVAGLETITRGTLSIGGRVVNRLEPAERDIAMVFQNYALYPHMTVYQNLAYGLKNRGVARAEIERQVHEAARMLDIETLLERKPRRLSGGQRQRVAMGRALVRDPAVFLFDEPLSNLDARLRVQMRVEIKKLQRRLNTTSLYVTHDQLEAMTLGDRLVVLNEGCIEQVGTPMEVYRRPASLFVAGFIGSPAMNLWDRDFLEARNAGEPLDALPAEADVIGVRPREVRLTPPDGPHLAFDATLELIEPAGAENHLYVRLAGSDDTCVICTGQPPPVAEGEILRGYVAHAALHGFNQESGQRID